MKLKLTALLVAATALTACAIDPAKIVRFDGRPVVAKEQAASVYVGSSKAFPNQIVTRWAYAVLEVDHVPVPKGKVLIQLAPGEYKLKISCGGRFSPVDFGWFKNETEATIRVEAGRSYFAWLGLQRDFYKIERTPALQSTETLAGRCWVDHFSGADPFSDVGS